MRNFSTTLIIFMVIAVIGSTLILRDTSFYEARYSGQLVVNGQVVPDTNVQVMMNDDRGSFIFSITHKPTQGGFNPLVMKSLADLSQQVCRYLDGVQTKKVGEKHIELSMQQPHNDVVCGKARVVFTGMDKARIQLNNGSVFELTRIPPTDGMLDNHQKADFKKRLKALS